VKLSKQDYELLRTGMRDDIIRLVRTDAPAWETIAAQRRLSRLDMAWSRGEDWWETASV
jgi:hypothetical protein